jgi:hypothetical protein
MQNIQVDSKLIDGKKFMSRLKNKLSTISFYDKLPNLYDTLIILVNEIKTLALNHESLIFIQIQNFKSFNNLKKEHQLL